MKTSKPNAAVPDTAIKEARDKYVGAARSVLDLIEALQDGIESARVVASGAGLRVRADHQHYVRYETESLQRLLRRATSGLVQLSVAASPGAQQEVAQAVFKMRQVKTGGGTGGKNSADAKRKQNKPRNAKILSDAKIMQEAGDISWAAKLAARHGMSDSQIRRIVGAGERKTRE